MKGFTLLETVITVGILLILAGIITTSWPRVRERQALVIAREQLQVLFRETQQQALNEKRDQTCLDQVDTTPSAQRRCSDVGVALRGNEIIVFADTYGDNNRYTSQDIELQQHTLSPGVSIEETDWTSFVFKGNPPNLELFGPTGNLIVASHQIPFTIQSGSTQAIVYVSPYGQLEE